MRLLGLFWSWLAEFELMLLSSETAQGRMGEQQVSLATSPAHGAIKSSNPIRVPLHRRGI